MNNYLKMNNVDLSHIIGKAQNGDIQSFEEIYNIFVKKIYAFVYQRVGHRETAEDITSDIFIKIYNNLSSYKDNGTFTAWLYTIARYTIADFWREQMKKSTLTLDEEVLCENHLKTIEEFFFHIDPELFPPEKETTENLDKYIEQLKDTEQKVIRERFYKTQSVKVTAKTLNMSESNVKVLTYRAIKKLSNIISQSSN